MPPHWRQSNGGKLNSNRGQAKERYKSCRKNALRNEKRKSTGHYWEDNHLKRKIRLKHPFSAWAQMAYLGDAATVPIPVGPPVLTTVAATIYFEIDGKKHTEDVPGIAAVTYFDREGQECLRPKVQLLLKILEVAQRLHESLEERLKSADTNSIEGKRLTSQVNGMSELLTKLGAQENLLRPFRFSSTHIVGGVSLEFLRDKTKIEGKQSTKAISVLIESSVADMEVAAQTN